MNFIEFYHWSVYSGLQNMRKSVFQQVQQVDLETRYATLSYSIGHNLSPELSTSAPLAPWLLLKSDFGIGALQQICCIFSEHL